MTTLEIRYDLDTDGPPLFDPLDKWHPNRPITVGKVIGGYNVHNAGEPDEYYMARLHITHAVVGTRTLLIDGAVAGTSPVLLPAGYNEIGPLAEPPLPQPMNHPLPLGRGRWLYIVKGTRLPNSGSMMMLGVAG